MFARHVSLTPRERDVLIQLLTGRSIESAAEVLRIAVTTARMHVKNLHRKCNTRNLHSLVLWATMHASCCMRAPAEEPDSRDGAGLVLLVDEEPIDLDEQAWERWPRLSIVEDERAAFDLIVNEREGIAIVGIGVTLPVERAVHLVRLVRAMWGDEPVVMAAARRDSRAGGSLLEAGCDLIVRGTLSQLHLLDRLRGVLLP